MSYQSANYNSGPIGFEEDPNLTPAEVSRIPELAEWVLGMLRRCDGNLMLFDDLLDDMRAAYIRGPVIDETMVYLNDQGLIVYHQADNYTWIQAL